MLLNITIIHLLGLLADRRSLAQTGLCPVVWPWPAPPAAAPLPEAPVGAGQSCEARAGRESCWQERCSPPLGCDFPSSRSMWWEGGYLPAWVVHSRLQSMTNLLTFGELRIQRNVNRVFINITTKGSRRWLCWIFSLKLRIRCIHNYDDDIIRSEHDILIR